MKVIYAILMLLLAFPVAADVLQWDAPTTRVDGHPLALSEISHYNLQCDTLGVVAEIPATAESQEYPIDFTNLLPDYGSYGCSLTTVDTDGRESEPSNTVDVVWIPANPRAPTIIIVIQ